MPVHLKELDGREVAAAVIQNFNNFTYRHVKKMFAREDSSSLDDEIIYTFDETIDTILFPNLKADVTCRKLFADIRDGATAYFKKFFDEHEQRRYRSSGKPDFYFGMWSDIILRTTDASAELMTIYYENLEPLERRFDDTTRANVIKKFFDKVGDNETLPSAYFQSRLGDVKNDLELATAAYDKVQKLSLRDAERPIKISVMWTLADVFRYLDRYTDEIPLREKIGREVDTYDIERFANILEALGRDDEAEQAFKKFIEDLIRRIEAFDEPNMETLELMRELVYVLYETAQAEHWRKNCCVG